MFTWRKLGKLFVPQSVPGKPWMAEFAQAPATLLFDNFLRVYFSCRPKADAEGRISVTALMLTSTAATYFE